MVSCRSPPDSPRRRRRRTRSLCSGGTRPMRGIFRGGSLGCRHGRCSLARSCCSRRRSAGCLPAYQAWLARWPTPAALAADPAGEAVRQWGRLGYPRRALRLHETATIVTEKYRGELPSTRDELLALPGIGAYTAAAVAVFAFGRKHAVLDTNVRRVLARLASGREFPGAQPSVAEYRLAESLLPEDDLIAARWSVAVMELGALTCTAAAPRCEDCPVARQCAWLAKGRPAAEDAPGRPNLRGHRQAMPGPPLGGPQRLPGAGDTGPPRRGMARRHPTRPGPGRLGRRRFGRPAPRRPLRPPGVMIAKDFPSAKDFHRMS